MRRKLIWIAPLAIIAMVAFISLGGVVVRELWNWLLPPLFGWRQINFWQALGLLVLCRLLFGGLGLHNSGRSGMRRRMRERMEQRMADRWERMTPEERDRYQQGMCGKWAPGPSTSESKGQ